MRIGIDILYQLLGKEAVIKIHRRMVKEDKQSADLFHAVLQKVAEQLDLDSGAEHALSRLQGLVTRGGSWDISLIRNNVFKAANALGIRLPSGMFASQKTAGNEWANRGLRKVEEGLELLVKDMAAHWAGEMPNGMMSDGVSMAQAILASAGHKLGAKLVRMSYMTPTDWVVDLKAALIKASREEANDMFRTGSLVQRWFGG